MRRRDFLYNAGLLFPAVLLSPALALASQKTMNADVLIIQDEAAIPAHLASVFNDLSGKAHQLQGSQISDLTYSKNGFVVTTSDNNIILTQKIVVHSMHRLHASRSLVAIKTGEKTVHLEYLSTNDKSKVLPEFWFLKASQLHTKKAMSFLDRNRHAVLCLSDT